MSSKPEFTPPDRFRILRRLGEGGMGIVYEVRDRQRNAVVALKTIKQLDGQALLQFKREFRALADLEHPNLVRLHELLEHHGHWFMTMELVPGIGLASWVRGWDSLDADLVDVSPTGATDPGVPAEAALAPALDETRLRAAFGQLAAGLIALHAAGKVHRDVKPSNVRVTQGGRVVLLDFGLVTDVERERGSTEVNLAVGTASYMAPEQATGAQVGPAADWYAVGVMLYEFLTGQLPYRGAPLHVLMAKQAGPPPPPHQLVPGISAELDSLCMRLLAFDPAARPSGPRVGAAFGAAAAIEASSTSFGPASTFVGREAELAELHEAWARTLAGKPTIALVRGQSGMGKSELTRRFLDDLEASDDGAVVLRGRCYERESVPYKAFDGIADSLSRYLGKLSEADLVGLMPRHAALLPVLFPVLGRVKALTRAAARSLPLLEPTEARARMFGALRELFVSLRERQPVVLFIDDLHWTDRDSQQLLEELLQQPSPPPLLLVATVRLASGEDHRGLLPAKLHGMVRAIEVGALAPARAADLLARMAPRLAAEQPELVAHLVADAGGHPLFLLELARQEQEAGGQPDGPRRRLDELIWARVQRLPAEARGVLELLAVASAPLPRRVVQRACDLPHEAGERALSLLRAGFLVKSSARDESVRFETYHDRVRETVLAHLEDDVRRTRHRALADALMAAGLATSEPQMLVRHFEAAGEAALAAQLARRAALLHASALAFERAAELYATALRLGDHDAPARRALLRDLADALASAARGPEAAEAYLQAADGADAASRLDCVRRAIEQLLITGHLAKGNELIESLFREVGMAQPRWPLAAYVWQRLLVYLRGYAWKERAPELVAEADLLQADLSRVMAIGYLQVDPVLSGVFASRALRQALALGDAPRALVMLCQEAITMSSRGGRRRLQAAARLTSDIDQRMDGADDYVKAWQVANRGLHAYFSARNGEAADTMQRSEAITRTSGRGSAYEANNMRVFRGFALRHAGRLAELGALVDECVLDAARRGDQYLDTTTRRGLAIVWLVRDRPGEARESLSGASWELPRGQFHLQNWYELEALGEIALYEGSVAQQMPDLAPRLAACGRSLLNRLEIIHSLLAWLEARLLLARSSGPAGRAGRRRAMTLGRRLAAGGPHGVVFGPLVCAAVAHQEGRTAEAVAQLRACIATADGNFAGHAAVARLRLAGLAGGYEGRSQLDEAEAWARAEGVLALDRFAQVLAPGFA